MARRRAGDSHAMELAEAKLSTSGLTLEDAKRLGIEILDGPATQALGDTFRPLCSLKLNYFDIAGKPVADWPNGPPFFRLRYLEQATDFNALTGKPIRYTQPPDTAPVAYYPRLVNWEELAKDVDQPLIITEGELKAAKACSAGFPTIGLGGVYNWRSYKLGLTWLPSLEAVNWVRRHVYIAFDSDYRTNPLVCAALHEVGEAFVSQGSFVHLVSLPQLPDLEKTGLDDFLLTDSTGEQFRDLLSGAEPLGLSKPLWNLNDKFVYVSNPGLIVDQVTAQKIAPSAFKEHHQATQVYQERTLRPNGTISYKPVSAAVSWLKWPLRLEASGLTYQPGSGRFVALTPGRARHYNTWPGWGIEPAEGDVHPFLELVDHVFSGAEERAKLWFLRWLAYPLQYPGVKLFTSAVVHGIRHGTGKSLLG